MSIQKIKKLSGFLLIASVTVALSISPASAKQKKSAVSAVVVYPTCLWSSDSDVTIAQVADGLGIPGPVMVTSTASGDHWVHCPVNLSTAIHKGKKTQNFFVLGVEVCHSESNGTDAVSVEPATYSHISQTNVTKLESPSGSEVESVDVTPYSSVLIDGTCLQSPMPYPFPIEGPVSIDLKLHFVEDGVFNFGRIRVLLGPKPDLDISDPSEPSEPSVDEPSSPSEISVPSLEPSIEPSNPE